jgi:hypothetical protein
MSRLDLVIELATDESRIVEKGQEQLTAKGISC